MILASSSKQRKELLEEHGYEFEILSVDTDEAFDNELSIYENIVNVARDKAIAVIEGYGIVNDVVVSADTIVYCDEKVLLKPVDYDDAFSMLSMYKDNEVHVISGVSVIIVHDDGNVEINGFHEESKVVFEGLTDDDIRKWLDLDSYSYCSGSLKIEYAIENMNATVEGSMSNVIGLPMEKLNDLLKSL